MSTDITQSAEHPADQLIDNPSVGFVSLGCPKAMVDSERIITLLRADGYRIGKTYDDSDVIIVNKPKPIASLPLMKPCWKMAA